MLKNKSAKKKVNKELLRRPDVYVTALSSKNELKAARSATTGEVFDTLDERIDCEVDRLNKKIDVTMLQQEDKESHTIENTVEGMTTDMVIKGRTLQNLIEFNKCKSNLLFYENEYLINKEKVDDTPWTNKEIVSNLLKINTTYSFIIQSLSNFNINFDARVKSDEIILGAITILPNEIKVLKITTNSTVEGLKLKLSSTDRNTLNSKAKIMLLEGDYTNKPIPAYFKGIKSFGEAEGNKISILSHGKNLFKSYEELISVKKGQQLYLSSKLTDGCTRIDIQIDNQTDITVSDIMYWREAEKVYRLSSDRNKLGISFAVNRDCNIKLTNKYLKVKEYEDIQLEEGTQSTSYEPYKCDKKDILLSELGFDEGLRGLNDIVYDELNSIKNVVIKRVDKYIVTGNENFITDIRGDYMYCYFILEGSKPSSGLEAICNQFKYIDGLWNKDNPSVQGQEGFDLSGSNSLSFQLSINKLETHNTEGVKKYFKSLYDGGNPVEVYYWLAEPIETPLDESIALKVFNEKTYVEFQNSISGTSSFKAPVNTVDTIARLNRENRALEEENKTLRQDFESTTLSLTDSDLELVKQNVDMDFRLMEVEFALDIPQAILSSNIKFKNKKGEVKSMARTPYEMMKIVILSGDYDREDYIHKVGKYYERGRMTKEEHDELMSLMTADEVISK